MIQKHCVYVTYHSTGKFYVGKGLTDLVLSGEYRGSGKKLKCAFKKYPPDQWITEIVSLYENEADAFAQEREWVDEDLLVDPFCLNLHTGGRGGGNEALWKKTWRNPSFQSKMSAKAWAKPEVQELQRQKTASRWKSGPLREQQLAGVTKLWQDSSYRARMTKFRSDRIKNIRWMTKNGTTKQVSLDQIDAFLTQGWKRGMK